MTIDWDSVFLEWSLSALDQHRWFALLSQNSLFFQLVVQPIPVFVLTLKESTYESASHVIQKLGGRTTGDPTHSEQPSVVLLWDAWEGEDVEEQTELIRHAMSLHPELLCVDGKTMHVQQISDSLHHLHRHIYYPGSNLKAYTDEQRGFWLLNKADCERVLHGGLIHNTAHIQTHSLDPVYIIDPHIGTWVKIRDVHFSVIHQKGECEQDDEDDSTQVLEAIEAGAVVEV